MIEVHVVALGRQQPRVVHVLQRLALLLARHPRPDGGRHNVGAGHLRLEAGAWRAADPSWTRRLLTILHLLPLGSLLLQLLLNLINFLSQEVIVLRSGVSCLVHVSLDLPSVGHQTVEPLVQHVIRVRGGEDGLDKLVHQVVPQVGGDGGVPLLGGLDGGGRHGVLNIIGGHPGVGLHKL